jgi:hypothetical protein
MPTDNIHTELPEAHGVLKNLWEDFKKSREDYEIARGDYEIARAEYEKAREISCKALEVSEQAREVCRKARRDCENARRDYKTQARGQCEQFRGDHESERSLELLLEAQLNELTTTLNVARAANSATVRQVSLKATRRLANILGQRESPKERRSEGQDVPRCTPRKRKAVTTAQTKPGSTSSAFDRGR